jgi:hypothetical protein
MAVCSAGTSFAGADNFPPDTKQYGRQMILRRYNLKGANKMQVIIMALPAVAVKAGKLVLEAVALAAWKKLIEKRK